MEKIIAVSDVELSYRQRGRIFSRKKHQVYNGLSFELYKGETLGIIGGNGAGKSSLLKLLAGIYKPDKGRVDNNSKKTSLLSLSAGFDELLNGRDNALISGLLMGFDSSDIYKALPAIEEYSELGEYFDQPIRSYSSGMKARLGFAIAAHLRPEVLLIDEVLSVGDKNFKAKAAVTIKDMISSEQTVVLVSHSMHQLKTLSDRVIWLADGVVKMVGEPTDVIRAYKKSSKVTV